MSEPQNMVEFAASAGIDAITDYLTHMDAKVGTLLILLSIEGQPEGEPDTVSAGSNVESAEDVIVLLGSHFIEAARQLGMRVDLLPVHQKGQG